VLPSVPHRAPTTAWPQEVSQRRNVEAERKIGSQNMLLLIVRLAQMAFVLTVVAVQLALLFESVQASRSSRISTRLATQLHTPPLASRNPIAQFQPLFLVGAIVSSAIIRLLGPKQCGPTSPQCPPPVFPDAKKIVETSKSQQQGICMTESCVPCCCLAVCLSFLLTRIFLLLDL
jgi:hypothetical protein